MRRFYFLFVLLVGLLAGPVRAQSAGDTTSVDCPSPQLRKQCVDFDATRSIDPAAGPQTYIWHMGDGTTLTGPKVSYCYKELKNYVVQLDVKMERTGELREAEKVYQVVLLNQDVVDFTASATQVRVNEPVQFEAADAMLPNCQNVQMIWDFRDGLQGRGRRVSHSFRKPGTFRVRLSLRAYGSPTCIESHCVSREITVVP